MLMRHTGRRRHVMLSVRCQHRHVVRIRGLGRRYGRARASGQRQHQVHSADGDGNANKTRAEQCHDDVAIPKEEY